MRKLRLALAALTCLAIAVFLHDTGLDVAVGALLALGGICLSLSAPLNPTREGGSVLQFQPLTKPPEGFPKAPPEE